MSQNNKIVLFIIILVGFIFPFIPILVIIEAFYLTIPFIIVFVVTSIFLIISLINNYSQSYKAFFIFLLLPTFILSQFASAFVVGKIQKFRGEQIVIEIEKIKNETGFFPKKYELILGMKYVKDREHFELQYSRGFMVKEIYDSKSKEWKSYGWND